MSKNSKKDRFSKKAWHSSAPSEVTKVYLAGDGKQGWPAWRDYLAAHPVEILTDMAVGPQEATVSDSGKRVLPGWLERLLGGSAPAKSSKSSSGPLSAKLTKLLEGIAGSEPDESVAATLVSLAYAIRSLAAHVGEEHWWNLVDVLVGTVDDATAIDRDTMPVSHQLLAGELPLVLSIALPELSACQGLAKSAGSVLSDGITALLDGMGLPHASAIESTRTLLACWTRCTILGEVTEQKVLGSAASRQYEWLVRQALRLTRGDGRSVFSPTASTASGADIWTDESPLVIEAMRIGGDDEDKLTAKLALPPAKDERKAKRHAASAMLPESTYESQWAEFATMRGDWTRKTSQLSVAHDGGQVRLELQAGGEIAICGPWTCDIRVGELELAQTSDWTRTDWESDEEVAYLRLQADFAGGVRVRRQICLAYDDGFAYLADSVLRPADTDLTAPLSYRGGLTLADGIRFKPAKEVNEGTLVASRYFATVIPLSLPEWQCDPAGRGELTFTPDMRQRLTLRQTTAARNLHAA